MKTIISVSNLLKVYKNGTTALQSINLEITEGQIFALLGPNGAGKTTLISIICGLLSYDKGSIAVGGYDISENYREARKLIGLVPQEIMLEPFETVYDTVRFSRGLFGLPEEKHALDKILRQLSLWDKRDQNIKDLSGGMKRRVMIAKALSHDPKILFLDEPSAGVDVELRRDMWRLIQLLKKSGVTIILTTHYIEEAEMIADKVVLIDKGAIMFVEEKSKLMKRMGKKELNIRLRQPIRKIPAKLSKYKLNISEDGLNVTYRYDTEASRTGITRLMNDLSQAGIILRDLETAQDSLEDIFVDLIGSR